MTLAELTATLCKPKVKTFPVIDPAEEDRRVVEWMRQWQPSAVMRWFHLAHPEIRQEHIDAVIRDCKEHNRALLAKLKAADQAAEKNPASAAAVSAGASSAR